MNWFDRNILRRKEPRRAPEFFAESEQTDNPDTDVSTYKVDIDLWETAPGKWGYQIVVVSPSGRKKIKKSPSYDRNPPVTKKAAEYKAKHLANEAARELRVELAPLREHQSYEITL